MRYLPLLIASMLAGCHSAYVPSSPSEPAESSVLPPRTSAGPAFKLVNSKKAVGHRDFSNAKKVLPDIFAGMEEDFYCGCPYVKTVVNFASCRFQPRKNPMRAGRIEWEHVVPAWVLGHQRQCWQQGGRQQCSDTDPVFQAAEGDLNNLVPAIAEINGDRNNCAYRAWTQSRQQAAAAVGQALAAAVDGQGTGPRVGALSGRRRRLILKRMVDGAG